MHININDVHAEVTDVFWCYTNALVTNDIDTVTTLFWDSEHTLRYGSGESLYGIEAIARFRDGQRGQKIDLEVTRLVITTFGHDFATANCEMLIKGTGKVKSTNTRMSHAWVRLGEGWKIVAAHVSPGPVG